MKNKLIVLFFTSLFIMTGTSVKAEKQNKKILLKGVVLDTESNPVENASVFIDGKNTKVLSDANGRFEIRLKPDVTTITVFTLGQGAAELAYHGEKELTFVLDLTNEDQSNSNFINFHKRNLSTNTDFTDKNVIVNADHYQTIYDLLARQPGVTVRGSTVRIRGIGTLIQSTTPLYIVNGIPVQSIDHISPMQVKSITILKDSDAAIYGVQGANGVIVIKLKDSIDN